MPLTFKGTPIANPPGRAVRFAGYPNARDGVIVICEITADALKALSDPEIPFGMESVFATHATKIFEIASGKYDAGAVRPRITTADILAVGA